MTRPVRAAVVDDAGLLPAQKLVAALNRIGFWEVLPDAATAPRIVIAPELAGFAVDAPTFTDPRLVEALIDLLHDRGFTDVAVVGSADGSALWAANREVYALADLLGYRFVTPHGRPYEILDLAEAIDHNVVPIGTVLHNGGVAQEWLRADIRIVFSKNRTDEADGYALCLDTLLGVLPLTDKNLHYRQRRNPGDVISELLGIAPVHFCLIDAVISAHGAGGRRSPVSADTDTIIAATAPVLADHIGALKMGLDPAISPVFARVARNYPLANNYAVCGTLAPYANWVNVPVSLLRTTRLRLGAEMLDRMIQPWMQRLDSELFPLKHPLDARLNAILAKLFETHEWLAAVNAVLGFIGQAVEAYRVMFDKDALRQQSVPLGVDVDPVPRDLFQDLAAEMSMLVPIAESAPAVSKELRWRYVDGAVVFRYTRCLAIPYDLFVRQVNIAHTIQFMNDYLGGVVVPLELDALARPIRQAERNIYLPQPNYLILYQGKPIDVSKLEVVEYADDRHRLYWKTIFSENRSATYDDGIASFERTADGTRVTIVGRQQFTLPPFWQVLDPDLLPDLKSLLVTHAYQTFFDRTLANFEALAEGRDIRIGRPVDEPAPPAAEQIMPLLEAIGMISMQLFHWIKGPQQPAAAGERRWTDADGFTHVAPAVVADSATTYASQVPEEWIFLIRDFITGLRHAAKRDLQAMLIQ